MNLIEVNQNEELASQNVKFIAQPSSSDPSSPVSTSSDDIFGDPIFSPCLGDDYQAEIPSMLVESQHFCDFEFPSKTGLSIPIMWVHIDDNKRELKDSCMPLASRCSSDGFNINHSPPSSSALKSEIIGSSLDNNIAYTCPNYQIDACKGCSPLPESRVSLWSEEETQSFLLALYIFGKNLVQVRKFIACKDMKDVLSFYYGKFYRSDAYHRWAECRKSRSRKCIQGQRIFTGWRQHELLSRILVGMSKEVQDSLLEAIRAFNEGRSSLEELVFTLKAAVGIGALIEAVAIGKGKQDLTGFILDPNRTNQAIIHSRPEIPTGKACSSLALSDIVKFLTGDFRLSKAKSNDLFWEAVWPRLLARGWHSERPRHICSKNALVFLIPDIRKFSRKLVKGDHYFDSVTDVLNKVASDPRLLELKTEETEGNGIAKDESLTAVSNHRRPSYLRPRFANCNAELMKFTVVDTSLVDAAAGSFKLRELRSLPVEVVGHIDMEEANSDSSTENSTDTSSNEKLSSEEACIPTSIQTNQPENLPNDSNSEGGNLQLNKRIQQDQSAYFAPLLKRQRLSACKQAMRNGSHKLLFAEKTDSDTKAAVEASEKASSAVSLGSLFEDSLYLGKPRRALFDLNQPQSPPDFDVDPLYQTSKQQNFDGSQAACNQNSSADEEPSSNGRRHGTRKRPPTAKALEALASGFLNVGRTGKDIKRTRLRGMRSRSSLPRRKAEVPMPATAVFTATAPSISFIDPDLIIPEVTYHASLFAEPQIQNERKEAHELLGMF